MPTELMTSSTSPLSADVLMQRLDAAAVPVGKLTVLPEVDSTNRWLLDAGKCGDVCLAERQLAGRGRRGRTWQSPDAGNIYLSVRWCFDALPQQIGWLSLMVGVAVAEALSEYGLQGHQLKWPNDVLVDGRKLGGILLQSVGKPEQVVVGIGLNVMPLPSVIQKAVEQPWCCLNDVLGHPVDRHELLVLLLRHVFMQLQVFSSQEVTDLYKKWQVWDGLYERSVRVQQANSTLDGVAYGLDEQGQLQVRCADGTIQVFSSADVSVRA